MIQGFGDGTYRTSATTRQEMAAVIIRALYGEDFAYSPTPHFPDVPSGNHFFKYIQKMFEAGISTGYGDGTFRPTTNATRGQIAAFLIRARFGDSFHYTSTPYFTDVPAWYQFFPYIQKLRDEGITIGCTATQYCVGNNVTRGAMAAFISRAFLGLP